MSLGIADRLNELYRRQAGEEAKAPWFPRPSALGGCLREMAWRMAGLEAEPRTPESMRVLELGHQRGMELEERCKAIWPDAETQVAVKVPVPWGEIPGTVDLWIPSLRTIVDFKTAGAYSMGLVVAGEKQDEGYALQLNAYRHGILNAPWMSRSTVGGSDAERHEMASVRTVLVYEAKDSDARKGVAAGMLYEQEVPYTVELEAAYQKRLAEIAAIINGQSLGTLDPLRVPGMPMDTRGKPHWRCRLSAEGKPLYCSIGPIRGKCDGFGV